MLALNSALPCCYSGLGHLPQQAQAACHFQILQSYSRVKMISSQVSFNTIEIIDCLSESTKDLQTGRSLQDHLLDMVPDGVPRIRRHRISSRADFWDCMNLILSESIQGWKPILHFEAHASSAGIEISTIGSIQPPTIAWPLLADALRVINVASRFNLCVVVAACEGLELLRPLSIKNAAPYMMLVAPDANVKAGILKSATQAFYDAILAGSTIEKAIVHYPPVFKLFLAQRFLANAYADTLKAHSFGRRRLKRVDGLVNMVLHEGADPEQLAIIREEAKRFSRACPDRFKSVQQRFLPGGVDYAFEQLVEHARKRPLR
jgi:hypothetical protein